MKMSYCAQLDMLAIGNLSGKALFWVNDSRKEFRLFSVATFPSSLCRLIAFSNDGKFIAFSNDAGTVFTCKRDPSLEENFQACLQEIPADDLDENNNNQEDLQQEKVKPKCKSPVELKEK